MREIVGAMIGTRITNNRLEIINSHNNGTVTEFLDRARMQFMAVMDLGANWELMANSPTLFCIDKNGQAHSKLNGEK